MPVERRHPTQGSTIDYDEVARVYDRLRVGNLEMVQTIVKDAPLTRNSTVLDVGCGTTNNTALLAGATGARAIGLDLSLGMLREACRKPSSLPLVHASAGYLPFRSGTFGFAYMTEVIHHLEDFRTALTEMSRVLKSAGQACVVTQSHQQIEERMTSRFFPGTVLVDQARYPTIESIEAELRRAGFADVWSVEHRFTPVRLGPEYLSTVEGRGYSMLHKISEDEYQRGLRLLRDAYSCGEPLNYSAGYTFIWSSKG
jgi:ubiquinone/menaquinone biosynthesis C-methylase UbiE